MTVEEWAALPEDEPGELVDGVLTEEELPDFVHEMVVTWLIRALGRWLGEGRGFIAGSEAKFALGERKGRKPDVAVFLPGRRPQARGAVRLPPDIMIEVVSPSARDQRRDRIHKLGDYARFGVRWYLLVDPGARTIEILELGADGRYAHALDLAEGKQPVPGMEGFELDADALWAEVDRLEAEEEPSG